MPAEAPQAGARATADARPVETGLGQLIELPLLLEPITPELALVDPALDRVARARLHEPGAFRPAYGRRPERVSGTLGLLHAPAPAPAPDETVARTVPRTRAPLRAVVAGGAVAVLIFVAGAVSGALRSTADSGASMPPVAAPLKPKAEPSRAEARPAAAPADPSAPTRVPAPAATSAPPVASEPGTPPAVPAPQAERTFAWAPAPGARGYEVQMFRGPQQVFKQRTVSTRLTLEPTWRHDGLEYTLRKGTYRWYVWPLREGGVRAAQPIVQAELTVPG